MGILFTNASAAQSNPCEAPIHAGVELRRRGRDADALTTFRRATNTCRSARLQVQIARAEQALGLWVEADHDFRAALNSSGDVWIERRRAQLQEELRVVQQHLGRLMVTGGVPGAEVFLDGERVAALPMVIPVTHVIGSFRLEVRRPGYYTVTRTISIEADDVTQEVTSMNLVSPSEHSDEASLPRLPAMSSSSGGTTQRTIGWVAAVGGGVALAGGVAAQFLSVGQADDFNSHCRVQNDLATERPDSALGDCQRLYDVGSTLQSVAVGAFVVGGVLALVSGVLLLTTPPHHGVRSVASFGCGLRPGANGLDCVVAF